MQNNNPFDLTGKVALITGGSRGIGEAMAYAYATAGAKVAVASRRIESCEEVAVAVRSTGGKAIAISCNTGDRTQVEAMTQRVIAEFGRIDICVNNAATNPHFGSLLDATDEVWDKTLQVNVKGSFAVAQICARLFLSQADPGGSASLGKIINVSSVAGLTPGQNMGVYSVSKAAVIMLTKALAQELTTKRIQVNAIAPGVIRTKFSTVLWSNAVLTDQVNHKAGRLGQPNDLAGAALFLASSASDYVTGTVMVVDGGLEIAGSF